METANTPTLIPIALLELLCPVCLKRVSLEKFNAHLEMHQHAEMTLDILALTRR